MRKRTSTRREFRCFVSLLIAAGAIGWYGCTGGFPGNSGGEGTLSGVVTNATTGNPIEGASVGLEPAVAGVSLTTDANGRYSASVPAGIYAVSFGADFYASEVRTLILSTGQSVAADAALTPTQAVAVRTSVSGDAVPGGTVTVTATTEVLDGTTTVSGYSWSQSNSVEVEIDGANTSTATVRLPDEGAYRDELIHVLREPPLSEAQLPPSIPLPEGEFPGGMPDRFQVVGINPFALEEAAHVGLAVTVATSSGDFDGSASIETDLSFRPAKGIRSVELNVPVLLTGKEQDSYNWSLSVPAGSAATLTDATSSSPYYTPDVSGLYRVTVTDQTGDDPSVITFEIYAGEYVGAITGQDAEGRPLAANCTVCHNGNIAPDTFTPWAQTGHAEIFSNSLDTNTHYSSNCFPCHTVGYEPNAENGGIDEASDYQDFLDSGLVGAGQSGAWTQVLDEFPDTAQLANIQCENCHGPQGAGHTSGAPRYSLSSNVCAVCHGEPLRHARYQQWQLSGHANYELAIEEGESGNCSRCHSANGFLAWLPILLDDDPDTDPLDNVEVTWDTDDIQPQTCVVCHDPHAVGTVSGNDTDANVYISGDTPPLIAGFQVIGAGKGAICMTCHNSRRGLRNDDNVGDTAEAARAPHGSAQTDVLVGQNAFFVEVGIRGSHSFVKDTCVACHMVETDPPELLSYNLGGANHTFYAAADVCAACHAEVLTKDNFSAIFEATSEALQILIEDAILALMEELTLAGNSIDLGGDFIVTNVAQIQSLAFGESRGRQAITVDLTNGIVVGPTRLNDVTVLDAGDTEIGALYDFADSRLPKAGWNWNLANNDGSESVHNPSFVFEFMDASIDALADLAAE